MLKPSQRLVAFAILHQTYSSQPPSLNPFISFLINVSTKMIMCKHFEILYLQSLNYFLNICFYRRHHLLNHYNMVGIKYEYENELST